MILASVRKKLNETGGIRVFRNGFRIPPFGDRHDDWVRLDESVRKRHFLFPHGNNNFLGIVELLDSDSKFFIERSSREGFVDNEAYKELVSFIYRSIIWATNKIAFVRKKKAKSGSDQRSPQEKLTSVKNSLMGIANDFEKEGNTYAASTIRNNVVLLGEGIDEGESLEKELLDKLEMYRVLAGLGLTIGDFTHEINHFLPSLLSDANSLSESNLPTGELDKAKRLVTNLDSLEIFTSYFNYSISQNVRRDKRPIEIRTVINQFIESTKNDRARTGTKLHEPAYSGFHLYTTPMHPSEWASILLNFYSNSKKAIRKAYVKGELMIRAGTTNDKIYIEFHDNGIGIPEENSEIIFDEFFTTSPPVGLRQNPHEEMVGTGLGLSIVSDIVSSYNGNVYLTEPYKGFNASFRVEVPKATNEELRNYDL